MPPFPSLRETPPSGMTPEWCAAAAALPAEDRARLAAEADALYAGASREERRKALWCWLALRDHLDPRSPADAPRATALLLGLPPGLADAGDLARRAEREGPPDLRLAATVHLGRVAADDGDLPGAEARFRSVLSAVSGAGSRIEFLACSSLAGLFLRGHREYEALVLSRRLVALTEGPGADPTMVRYSLLCMAEAMERLEEWELVRGPLEAIARSLKDAPPSYERTVRVFAGFAGVRRLLALGRTEAAEAALDGVEGTMRLGIAAAEEGRVLPLLRARVAMDRGRWEEARDGLLHSLADPGPGDAGRPEALALLVRCRAEAEGPAAAAAAAGELLGVLEGEGPARHGSGGVLTAATAAAASLGEGGEARTLREELLWTAAGAALLRVLEIDRCVREIPEAAAVAPEDARLLRDHRARFTANHRSLLDTVRRRLAAEHRSGRAPLVRLRTGTDPLRACAWCARLKAPDGRWIPVAHLVPPGLGSPVTHGICPDCATEFFPGFPPADATGG